MEPDQADVNVDGRTPMILVTGLNTSAVARTVDSLVVAGTTVVHHDLDAVAAGRVRRTLRSVDLDGTETVEISEIDLEHGCVSCTMRLDLLPLLRELHRGDGLPAGAAGDRSHPETIVLQLDPRIEPEALCWAVQNVLVTDQPGIPDGPAGRDVRVEATIACVDEESWLSSATGDETLAEAGLGESDDDRTLAQVVVGQVAFADALVVAAADPAHRDRWETQRTVAVLTRLAPRAPMLMELPQRRMTSMRATQLLRAIPADSRRGRVDDPHDPLLADRPPLDFDGDVGIVEFNADRPFHPARLHHALDVFLDGVVTARGRLWSANRPDQALWLESCGAALRIADGGAWLAAMSDLEWDRADPQRRAMAALRWHPVHGDRHTALVILVNGADPAQLTAVLDAALLDDDELALGPAGWRRLPDPFRLADDTSNTLG
ncbi:MAG: GTP-binding protein [Gordonia sp. (in: high G+C Gram-positive bacteria)]